MTQCPIPELHARAESGSTATGIVVNAARSKRAATGRRILQEPGRHGASPKSQSWLIYAPPANRAGPVLRAGLTDAFVTESGTDESESGIVRLGCRQILRLAPFEVVPMITYRKKNLLSALTQARRGPRSIRAPSRDGLWVAPRRRRCFSSSSARRRAVRNSKTDRGNWPTCFAWPGRPYHLLAA
jgi:hypothetical protein